MESIIKMFKIGSSIVIVGLLFLMYFGLTKIFDIDYIVAAPMTFLLAVVAVVLVTVIGVKTVKYLLYCALFLFSMQSCHYAKSNQQVVTSSDCGMTWSKVDAGDAVPKGTANPCYMKVVIPNFPMQGESRFICNLKNTVRVTSIVDYDYSIIEPLSFIKQAKYLGKRNADADGDDALDNKAFESAENAIIDIRIKEVAKDLFLQEDIVELQQSVLEDKLRNACNEILAEFGVKLNFITLTFDLDEQTRQAIDVATAMKIYESRGLTDLGKQVVVSRAGAPKITVNNTVEEKQGGE